MIFSTILLLFGTGIWAPGLESISVEAIPTYKISFIEKKWKNYGEGYHKNITNLDITARAVMLLESDSMVDIYSKGDDLKLPMASLTKLMTALIIVENHDLEEIVVISKSASLTEGSTMHLMYGETLTVRQLLKGLLMNSGNDSAIALSQYHSGTVYNFVNEMNIRANDLYMNNTHFVNPHGLDNANHYSSTRDLIILAKFLWKYPEIKKIVNTKFETVISLENKYFSKGVEHTLKNTNKLLDTIFQVYGMKTGTTINAGQCLLLVLEKDNKEYFLVILGSNNRYQDARNILYKLWGDVLKK